MPGPRIGGRAMTPAERQARPHGSSPWAEGSTCPASPGDLRLTSAAGAAHPAAAQRWAAAVAALIDLQDQYRAWLDNLPASLEGSRLAENPRVKPAGRSRGAARHRYTTRLRPRLTEALDRPQPPDPPTATQEVNNQRHTAGAHRRRQDHGGEPSCPVMSRSCDRRSPLE